MVSLAWSDIKSGNALLKSVLNAASLEYADGYFIVPDDRANRKSKYPNIRLEMSAVELFELKYPAVFGNVHNFYEIIGCFDRLNFRTLKDGVKLIYFLSAAYHVQAHRREMHVLENVQPLYSDPLLTRIQCEIRGNLLSFLVLARDRRTEMNLYALFELGKRVLLESAPKVHFEDDMGNLKAFLRTVRYNPFGARLGQALEREVQSEFEQYGNSQDIAALAAKKVGESGVIVPLDADPDFCKVAQRLNRPIAIPDYAFITKHLIIPLDLKSSLDLRISPACSEEHHLRQIRAHNLRALFENMPYERNVLFRGLTVEGKSIR